MADFDAIVIGSGAGGLSNALRMSQLGLSVLLLEAMPSFGGYMNPFSRSGYDFDTGVHYLGQLGPGGSFRLLLQLLGVDREVEFVELNPAGFDRFIFPDFELQGCKGQPQYQERLHRLFPEESKAIKRYFHILQAFRTAVSDPHGAPQNWLERIMYVVRNPVLVRYFRSTYQQLLDGVTHHAPLQAALSAHCANSGSPPNRASAFVCLMTLDHYLNGAFYPKGGSGALRDAFIAGLRRAKVRLQANARVTRIGRAGADFLVDTSSGEHYTARAVVSNADPVITLGQLVDPDLTPASVKKKVARLTPSFGAFYAFIGTGLDLGRTGLSDANLVHFEHGSVNRCFENLALRGPADSFPFFFITSPSLKDPESRHSPDGFYTLQILSGFGPDHPFLKWSGTRSRHRGQEYEQLKNRIGGQLIQSAERYLPDLSRHLDYVEFATPLSNEYWVNSYHGANFGLEQTPRQFGPGRFYDCTSGIAGLYLVGSGAIGAGVLSCVASGVWAANQVADFLTGPGLKRKARQP